MAFLIFILSYSLLIVLSSFFLKHWHTLTRHQLEMQPNGEIKVVGFLPKWWSYFIEYKKGSKKTYYEGVAETAMVNKLPSNWMDIPITDLEVEMGCLIEINEGEIFFYLQEPIYRFPEWIRNPLSECPTCMASVYGSGIYLFFVYCVKDVFSFANYATVAFFLFWFLFIVVLSYGTNFLSKNQ